MDVSLSLSNNENENVVSITSTIAYSYFKVKMIAFKNIEDVKVTFDNHLQFKIKRS